MNANTPPDPYFNNIDFNPTFYQVIQQYLTEAYANSKYLKLTGGSLSGFLGIGRTARTQLDVNGKVVINDNAISTSENGLLGGAGTRIILYEGSEFNTPYAFGINTNTLWYSVPSTATHRFYTGTNERMTIDSVGDVGIGTANPQSKLTINPIPLHGTAYDYSLSPVTITNTNPTSTLVLNDPKPVLHLCREGTGSQAYASKATFNLCRYENVGVNSRTRLDLTLTHSQYDEINVLSIRSDGGVGIGTTDPGTHKLSVIGTASIGSFLIVGNDGTSIPYVQFGQTNGHNLGVATEPNVLSTSALTGDMVLRAISGKKLILQNGAGAGSLIIDSNNNVGIGITNPGTNKLYVNGNTTITGSLIINDSALYLTTSGSSLLGVATVAQQYSTSSSIGDTVLRAQATKRLMLQSGTAEPSITIDSTKYVNIGNGVVSPAFPITISTTLSQSLSLSSYAIAGTSSYLGNQTTPITPNIMLGILGTSAFNTSFYVYSDKRIKKDINPIENSLDIIEKLNPVIYKYIDFIEKGNLNNYGVIAQEVEHILPDIINKHKDFIPNIYKNVDSYDNKSLILSIDTTDLSIGDSIKLYDANNKVYIRKIINIDGDKITIDEKLDDYEDGTNVFLYGKEEKEVKNINYEALFTINLKATQELYKRLKKLEDVIKNISL